MNGACLLVLSAILSAAATELHHAAASGNTAQINALVSGGMPVGIQDDRKLTPLHVASAARRL